MGATSSFSARLADALEERAERLTRRWVERLTERLDVDHRDTLPSDSLLNHIPVILSHIAEYVRDPESDVLEATVVHDLRDLADLRRRQGFTVGEVVEEFEILSAMVQDEAEEVTGELPAEWDVGEVVRVVGRLHRGLNLLSTATADFYREENLTTRRTRASFLGRIGQVLVHEMKNRLGGGATAARVLADPPEDFGEDDRDRLRRAIVRSIDSSLKALEDVRRFATVQGREGEGADELTPLRSVVTETLGDLESDARASGVELMVEGEVPGLAVDGALARLILANLVSNGIRYADGEKDDRWVRVRFHRRESDAVVEVQVEDNGVGIPPEFREDIFDEFDRAGRSQGEGLGLGLSIVREAVDRLGGEIRVESEPGSGSLFAFTLPGSAAVEREAEGGRRGRNHPP